MATYNAHTEVHTYNVMFNEYTFFFHWQAHSILNGQLDSITLSMLCIIIMLVIKIQKMDSHYDCVN